MEQLFKQFLFIHLQALKDLQRSLQKKVTIFITIFTSVFILFVISILNQSLNQEIRSNTKSILGGDAEIEVKNNPLPSSFIEEVNTFADLSLNTTVASMVANKHLSSPKTSFVQLRAVDDLYPLYGNFETSLGKVKGDFFQSNDLAIINENLSINLQIKEGEELIIRDQTFTVHSIIKQMPDLGGAGLFGDLVVISQLGLEQLEIQPSENFFEYEYRIRYFSNLSEQEGKQKLLTLINEDPKLQVRFPENTSNFIQRTLNNFANFLSLISLAAILIAGIGISNTIIAYINQNYNSIAVQKSLGLNTRMIQSILAYQIFFITIVICLVAYLISSLAPHFVNSFLPTSLNFSLSYVGSFRIFFQITSIALIAITIFLIPALSSIQQLSANSLFRNTYEFVSFRISKKNIIVIFLLIIVLMVIFTAGSSLWLYNILFLTGFILAVCSFYYFFKFVNYVLAKVKTISNLNLLLTKRNIASPNSVGPIILTTLGIGISLLLTILIIASSFQNLIQKSLDTKTPDFFFIGIDQSSKDDFFSYIYSQDFESDLDIVPIATAQIKTINGIDPLTYIDKNNGSYWVIQEERRISWLDQPADNNPIIKGEWWSSNDTGEEMLISFDADAAKDLQININDQVTLSIYGRDVTGTVKNFRKVDYADFTINFAMLLNQNYAQSIPHEYLATVKLSNGDNFQEFELLQKFPNISSIKISNYANKINQLLKQVNIAVIALVIIVILIGLLVISSATLVQGKNKIYQNLIMKILGLSKKIILQTSLLEFMILFISTIYLTLLISGTASYLVVKNIFNIDWVINFKIILSVYVLTGIFTLMLIIYDTYRSLIPRAYPLIRNN